MALTRISPALALAEAVDRMYDHPWARNGGARFARLPIDVYSTDNEIVLEASLPGIDPEAVEITVEGDELHIHGEIEPRLDNVRYLFTERFHGAFSRTLKLNVPVDVDNIEASFEQGVLRLVLPKAEEIRPKTIKVQAK